MVKFILKKIWCLSVYNDKMGWEDNFQCDSKEEALKLMHEIRKEAKNEIN